MVKPLFLSLEDKAEMTRDTLRVLVRQEALPEQFASALLQELDHKFWTRLFGVNNCRFTRFEDFCRDPNGLRTDPAVVERLITKLRGSNALKLVAAPASKQGNRNDLGPETSRPGGERSKTPRTDSRRRTISAGPAELRRAFEAKHLGDKDAERLASYARAHAACPKLKSILQDLKTYPTDPSPELLRGLRARIRALPTELPRRKNAAPRVEPASSRAPAQSTSARSEVTCPAQVTEERGTTEPAASKAARAKEPDAALAAEHSTTPEASDIGGVMTSWSTTAAEVALLRFFGGWLDLKRTGLGGVDPAALVRILVEVGDAGCLPNIPRVLQEVSMLCEAAQILDALDSSFPGYAQLVAIARREACPSPAILNAARDEARLSQARDRLKRVRRAGPSCGPKVVKVA